MWAFQILGIGSTKMSKTVIFTTNTYTNQKRQITLYSIPSKCMRKHPFQSSYCCTKSRKLTTIQIHSPFLFAQQQKKGKSQLKLVVTVSYFIPFNEVQPELFHSNSKTMTLFFSFFCMLFCFW